MGFEFNSWLGMIINEVYSPYIQPLRGYLFFDKEKIYIKQDLNLKDTNRLLVFDFGMPIGNRYQYYNSTDKMNYSIELENKFIDKNDTIYKLKYHNPNRLMHGLDLVFYLEREKGVLGMYLSCFNEEIKEDEMYSFVGQIFDFKKLRHINRVIE